MSLIRDVALGYIAIFRHLQSRKRKRQPVVWSDEDKRKYHRAISNPGTCNEVINITQPGDDCSTYYVPDTLNDKGEVVIPGYVVKSSP